MLPEADSSSEINWRSVALSASSGMLLTNPIVMHLLDSNGAFLPSSDALRFAESTKTGISFRLRALTRLRGAPDSNRQEYRRCARCRCLAESSPAALRRCVALRRTFADEWSTPDGRPRTSRLPD